MDKQQAQTKEFFAKYANQWQKNAQVDDMTVANIITQRNQYVIDTTKESSTIKTMLDVGCGSGELACELGRLGIVSTGVDFAQDMIDLANESAKEIPNVEFVCASIFDYDPKQSFDLISALGFIEYISLDDLDKFLQFVVRISNSKGQIVIGSRNRLFNITTFNKFTELELENGTTQALLREAIILSGADNKKECFDKLIALDSNLPQFDTYPTTGVKVDTRHQYTPSFLAKKLHKAGLVVEDIYPCHYHGLPISFGKEFPEIHGIISNQVQPFAKEHLSLIPHASTFLIRASKP